MENAADKITYVEQRQKAAVREVERQKEAEKVEDRLTTGEKVTFSVAAIFSTAVLVILVMLTVVGFIFSPIADTLVFALLTGAMGITSYVVWRGGRRHAR